MFAILVKIFSARQLIVLLFSPLLIEEIVSIDSLFPSVVPFSSQLQMSDAGGFPKSERRHVRFALVPSIKGPPVIVGWLGGSEVHERKN